MTTALVRRQRAFCARQRAFGKCRFSVWLLPGEKAAIKALLAGTGNTSTAELKAEILRLKKQVSDLEYEIWVRYG
jgi:hypothetical protein